MPGEKAKPPAAEQRSGENTGQAQAGIVVMDLSLKPVAMDRGAAAILNGTGRESEFHLPPEVAQFLRGRKPDELALARTQFTLGAQKYSCRAYVAEPERDSAGRPLVVLHLQKEISPGEAMCEVAANYHLTYREQQALRGISMGLTSKELAERMNISPNTVKAFLRLIKVKMGAATRAAMVAKLFEHDNGAGPGETR